MCCRVQREMTGIENVNSARPCGSALALPDQRKVILTPDHQQARPFLAHPGLPLRVGIHIGSVVVEEIALDLSLVGLIKKVKLVSPRSGS
jgi:class 3 adenylate cyclase